MGRRDYRRREKKTAKKDIRKTAIADILPPTPTIEIIKKGKKEPKAGEEEQ